MPLIKCAYCGKEYSDLLSVCKHCKKRKETIVNSDVTEESINGLKTNHKVDTKKNDWWAEKRFIVIAIIVIGIYYFYNSGNVINEKENSENVLSECECVEIFKSEKQEFLTGKKPSYSAILNCMNLYVQFEKSDGTLELVGNINPCFKEALKYPTKSIVWMMGECDCREGFISISR